jgi:hypothetical protein
VRDALAFNSAPRWLTASLLALSLLAGCASLDPYGAAPIAAHLNRSDAIGDCARLFRNADKTVDAAGVRDAMAPRVPGFPYLRVDRFSAGLAPQLVTPEQHSAWRERLAALDQQARELELRNAAPRGTAVHNQALIDCRERLQQVDQSAQASLLKAATVPDDYSTALRWLGVYPLTKLFFAAGVRRWQQDTLDDFAVPLDQLPRHGELVRYAPQAPIALDYGAEVYPLESRDVLGLPQLPPGQLERLIARHAPLYAIETATDDDRIGQLIWQTRVGPTPAQPRVLVDHSAPAAYARVAHTQLGGQVHLQLIYTVWFAARPPKSSFDPLAGRLDGLLWRVTLDENFEPLIYDTIHPCGCYHLFFPTRKVRARTGPIEGQGLFDEGLFVPQQVEAPGTEQRILLRLAARSHYVQRVLVLDDPEYSGAGNDVVYYTLRDEDELRALPLPAGDQSQYATRSVYGADALIAGSERLERYFFWPMGVPSAGQMRQWGHHATAFVGRRHFDDPLLLDRYFEVVGAQ